jgi:anti-sigma regulatory factor (Ser/Thr protein kinase)
MVKLLLDRLDAPRAARRVVASECARAATGPECADHAGLMTSEVVTNAVLHGTGEVTFAMDAGAVLLRVEVGDGCASRPTCAVAEDRAEGGRGMGIVDALASDWGVTDDPPGKIVWFEVPVHP